MKKSGFVIIFFTGICGLLFVGCDLGKPKNASNREASNSGQSTNTVRDAVRDATSTVELPEIYTDPKYGFRFNYSKDWVKKDRSVSHFIIVNHNSIGEAGFAVDVRSKDPNLMKMQRSKMEQILKKAGTQGELLDFKKMKFDGLDCVYYRYSNVADRGVEVIQTNYDFNFADNCFTFHYFFVKNKMEEYESIFNAVLKSFKLPQP